MRGDSVRRRNKKSQVKNKRKGQNEEEAKEKEDLTRDSQLSLWDFRLDGQRDTMQCGYF